MGDTIVTFDESAQCQNQFVFNCLHWKLFYFFVAEILHQNNNFFLILKKIQTNVYLFEYL